MNRTILVGVAALLAIDCRGRVGAKRVDAGAPVVDARPRTAHPLTPARLDAVSALAIPGYVVRPLVRGDGDVTIDVTAADGTRVVVTASSCLACVELDLGSWTARRPGLAALWAPGADAIPAAAGATLAIAEIGLAAAETAIAIDARRIDGSAAYVAHWNDGVTQLDAICEVPTLAQPPVSSPCAAVIAATLSAAVVALR